MTSFDALIHRIEHAYAGLGHTLGWRFLASPKSTLSPDTRLGFVGLNPGGSRYHPPGPSVEAGNAYRLERWARDGGLNGLQRQVLALYDHLATKLGFSSPQLMDETLAAQFCPFRSPSWEALPNRHRSVAFSRELWGAVLGDVQPPIMMCLGGETARHLGDTLVARGARPTSPMRAVPVGWGPITCGLAEFQSILGRTLLVRLPHLSRFRIFGRPASLEAVDEVTDAICEALQRAS